MISVSLLGLLVYAALGCAVLIPVILAVMLVADWKRGKMW